jgi:hypothetical protein
MKTILGATSKAECLAGVNAMKKTLAAGGSDMHDLANLIKGGGGISEAESSEMYQAGVRDGRAAARAESTSVAIYDDDDWRSRRDFCAQHSRFLRSREQEFIADLENWTGDITERQQGWLNVLYARLQRRAV